MLAFRPSRSYPCVEEHKGAKLTLNMHYNPKGALATDKTRIALVFARGPIDKVVLTSVSSTRDLDVPPGEANYEANGKPFVFDQDSHIVSLLPRMNERGKDFTYTLVYPDGRSEILLSIPKFDDEWQPSYVFKTAIAAPKGSRLETIAHFDNSANNKRNPDPTQRVPFGPEILNGYLGLHRRQPASADTGSVVDGQIVGASTQVDFNRCVARRAIWRYLRNDE